MGGWLAAAIATLIVAVLGALLIISVITPSEGGDRRINVVAPSASHFIPGLDVRAAGQKVGEVTDTELTPEGRARLELRIDDENVWPLARGTKAQLRFGGTIKYTSRYVELDPPARRAAPIPNGGTIAAADVVAPEEFDELIGIFDPPTRRDLRATLDRGGAALGGAQDELHDTLEEAPPAVAQARGLLEDLGADQRALGTLVRSSDRVVHAVDSANPGLDRLLAGAATTFEAVGSRAAELERALADMPRTLVATRQTLSRAEGTLAATGDLTRRLSPGVRELRRITPPVTGVLDTVVDVGPDARRTLSTLRGAVPDLDPFLTQARRLMPRIESIARQSDTQLNCIRPYAPEIAGLFTTWTAAWGNSDGRDHYVRAHVGGVPVPSFTPLTSGELKDRLPQLRMAFPRPPGALVGKPWFIEECGYTPDALDPHRDPESVASDPLSRQLVGFDAESGEDR